VGHEVLYALADASRGRTHHNVIRLSFISSVGRLCSYLGGTVYFHSTPYFRDALFPDVWDGSTHTFSGDFSLIFLGSQRLDHGSFKFATAHRVRQDGECSREARKKLALYARLRETGQKAIGRLSRILGKTLCKKRYIASDFRIVSS
jgi:hypothetical protein